MRTLIQNAALALLAISVTLASVEAATRMSLSATDVGALPHVGGSVEDRYRKAWRERRARRRQDGAATPAFRWDVHDPLLGWRPRPDVERRHTRPGAFDVVVRTNSTGLRGTRDFALDKAPSRQRIAIFGCSQTFGGTIAEGDTFSDLLAASLPGVEVLNFGVHGYGTDQMLLRFERDGISYAPDVVVVAFAAYHMERNAVGFRFYAKPRFVLDGADLRLTGTPVPPPDELAATPAPPAPAPWADHSVLLRWLWGRVLDGRIRALQYSGSPGWPVTRALIERFAERARQHDMALVLLNLEDVDPEIETRLATVTRELGVSFVNTGPEFRRLRDAGRKLRHRGDFHWTRDGHRVIADALREHLCEHDLVDCADTAGR